MLENKESQCNVDPFFTFVKSQHFPEVLDNINIYFFLFSSSLDGGEDMTYCPSVSHPVLLIFPINTYTVI